MKIETGNNATVSTLGRLPKQNPKAGATAKAEKAADQDFVVTISDSTKVLSEAAHADETEIRWDKVAAIREQLASGNYNISGKDVATKILDVLSK